MNHSLFVCLLASTLTATSTAQVQTPPMRQGISVQMAKTANAIPMPEADNEDAWVITVTADGHAFFGAKPVTAEGLTEVMRETPRHRDQDLYLKADARTSFGNLKPVLKAAAVDGFESAVLLTNQNETPALGKLVAPKGLTVVLAANSAQPVTVQLRESGQKVPKLLVNDREIVLSDLQSALNQALQGQNDRVVQLEADDNLPFAQVALVIDASNSINARVVIPSR
jgi:biopolymer transport protein ExbD